MTPGDRSVLSLLTDEYDIFSVGEKLLVRELPRTTLESDVQYEPCAELDGEYVEKHTPIRHSFSDFGETETVFECGIDLVYPLVRNRTEVLADAVLDRDCSNLATERD